RDRPLDLVSRRIDAEQGEERAAESDMGGQCRTWIPRARERADRRPIPGLALRRPYGLDGEVSEAGLGPALLDQESRAPRQLAVAQQERVGVGAVPARELAERETPETVAPGHRVAIALGVTDEQTQRAVRHRAAAARGDDAGPHDLDLTTHPRVVARPRDAG